MTAKHESIQTHVGLHSLRSRVSLQDVDEYLDSDFVPELIDRATGMVAAHGLPIVYGEIGTKWRILKKYSCKCAELHNVINKATQLVVTLFEVVFLCM